MKLCHRCGTEWVSERRLPARTETCAQCGFDLKCCLNCRFYDPNAPNQCVSSTTELVVDKERANFCDEFEFVDDRGPEKQDKKKESGRSEWEKLFGDS